MSEGKSSVYKLGNVEVPLLPHLYVKFSTEKPGFCAYFESGILGSYMFRKGLSGASLWTAKKVALMNLRIKWMVLVSVLSRLSLGKAKPTTWQTRMNCRAVIANQFPHTRACRFLRCCPFCYARACWREYSRVGKALFKPGRNVSHRQVTIQVKRFHFIANTVDELEGRIRQAVLQVRATRNADKSQRSLATLEGWFRCQRTWVQVRKDGKFVFVLETMLLGASKRNGVFPIQMFLPASEDPIVKKGSGLREIKTWTVEKMTKREFRKTMLKYMRFRKELLESDIAVSVAYNRPMLELKAQQFDSGGSLGKRSRAARVIETEQQVESREADEQDDT